MSMIGSRERGHIRNMHSITEDMHDLASANIRFADSVLIDDHKGAKKSHDDELHKAFVLYAHVVDYLEDCNVIDKDTRRELVTRFHDIIDDERRNSD